MSNPVVKAAYTRVNNQRRQIEALTAERDRARRDASGAVARVLERLEWEAKRGRSAAQALHEVRQMLRREMEYFEELEQMK